MGIGGSISIIATFFPGGLAPRIVGEGKVLGAFAPITCAEEENLYRRRSTEAAAAAADHLARAIQKRRVTRTTSARASA